MPPQSGIDLEALYSRRPEAVDAWFNTYSDAIYTFVFYRSGGDPDLAADVSQDVFVTALERIGEYDNERGEMFPWLTYLARNLLRKALRRRARHQSTDPWESFDRRLACSLTALAEAPLPQEVLEREEIRDLVRIALSNLPYCYQRALHQRYFEQRSVREIADAEGASQGAVKVLLYRARQAFRAAFEAVAETIEQGGRSSQVVNP